MRPCARRLPAVALLLLLLASRLASAGHDERATQLARDHFRRGQAEYALMHYDLAIVEFEAAYRLQPLPALLYNIGRCHAATGRSERAATMYQRYLDLRPDADDRDAVRAEIERLKATPPPATAPAPAPPSSPPPGDVAPAPAPTLVTSGPAAATPSLATAAPKPLWRRAWFWSVLGGAVAVGAGAGVGLWLGLSPRDASVPGSDLGAMEF